jgi:uncharacterized protein (TIGR02996 family)
MVVRRTYPPDLGSELREIASHVTQGSMGLAFASLTRLHAARPRERLRQLLVELRASDDSLELAAPSDDSGTREEGASDDALDSEEATLLDAIAAMIRPRIADEEELWAAVFANPASDQARLVLADALSGRGDPRGELIVLQVSDDLGSSGDRSARERELLRQFGSVWLGSSKFKVVDPVFRRGFLAEAKFVGDATTDLDDPTWRTLEVLERDDFDAWPGLLHENLRPLKKVFGLSGELLERAARDGRALEVEHVGVCPSFSAFAEALLRRRVLPRLRRVDVACPGELDAVFDWAIAEGLVLGCNEPLERLPALVRRLQETGAPAELVVGLRGSWTHVATEWPRWSVRVRSEPRLLIEATHHGGDDAEVLLAALDGLPVEGLVLTRKGRPRATAEAKAALVAELHERGVPAELRGW